jgi:adenylate kinase
MVIIISGTPATGKTTLAKHLCLRYGFVRLDVSRLVKRISEGYDKKRKCEIVDTTRFVQGVLRMIAKAKAKNQVIDSHLSHYLPPESVELCIITKCDLLVLKKRLDARYDSAKVRENLDAEIFDLCYNEAKEFGHKVAVVDTTKGIPEAQVEKIMKSFLIKKGIWLGATVASGSAS